MVLVLVFIVHGHVRPIGQSGCRGEALVTPRLARGLHVSLG
jgi:hypothetical protein